MSISPEENVQLQPLTTLGITATVDYLIRIADREQIKEAVDFAHSKRLPLFPLGGGSNIVLGAEHLHCVALKLEFTGREILRQTDNYTDVRFGAGENWDATVAWSVEQNLHGIEALSLIPGSVGAAPVQNIGAYGQELHETVTQVEAYDLENQEIITLTNTDCEFGYRDSMFKHAGKRRYLVLSVTLRLTAGSQANPPAYASLQAELGRRSITKPTVADIRDAVIAIRRSKLPDPAKTPTAGSFFHNPIISTADFQQLEIQYPAMPHWPTADGRVKLAGAWLIEQCGFKGTLENGVGIYDKQALALINPGHRNATEVLAFRDKIITAVQSRFGVKLHMEPELITF